MDSFISLIVWVSPSLFVGIVLLILLPKKDFEFARFFIYALGFVLIRDAWTPLGLWIVKTSSISTFTIRFKSDDVFLILSSLSSVGIVWMILKMEQKFANIIKWKQNSLVDSILWGIFGFITTFLPILLCKDWNHQEPGEKPSLFPLFMICMLGNLYEEVLFRGIFQGLLESHSISSINAAVASGLLFGYLHSFLSFTVTQNGLLLLLFTVYEGLIAAFVRNFGGVIASAIAHGNTIFFLSIIS